MIVGISTQKGLVDAEVGEAPFEAGGAGSYNRKNRRRGGRFWSNCCRGSWSPVRCTSCADKGCGDVIGEKEKGEPMRIRVMRNGLVLLAAVTAPLFAADPLADRIKHTDL